ncbi:MAG: P-loop NTPase [Chloroflexi bacterium]|nr:P-loop NTPase [Chloroflexota bacterium]
MVKKVVWTHYICEVCGRQWNDETTARLCESSPPPRLTVGDVVIWHGRRDEEYGALQTLVLDRVKEVHVDFHGSRPGHRVSYSLEKQRGIDEIPGARSGYVNLATRFGGAMLHTDQLGTALRETETMHGSRDLPIVVARLQAAGIQVHNRIFALYRSMRELEYSLTWAESFRQIRVHYLTAGQRLALEWVAREPTDDECLGYVGGREYRFGAGRATCDNLAKAFDHNHYIGWAAMVSYDLNAAFALVSEKSDGEIIAAVRAYRAAVLAGEAPYYNKKAIEVLFPLDYSKASGHWPKDVLAWVRQQEIKGGGKTRLERVYDHALSYEGESETVNMQSHLRLWQDKTVIAVTAAKGGVGKSTVAADLARALQRVGQRVLVFDADIYGPSQHIFFPVSEPMYRAHEGKIVPHSVDVVEIVSVGYFLGHDESVDWRGSYLPPALHMIGANLHTEAEIVIVDMPPGTGDVQRAMSELCPSLRYVVVTTAGEIAMSDVRRLLNMLPGRERAKVIGVVENMASMTTVVNGQVVEVNPWGDESDAPALAAEYYYRFLGKIPHVVRDPERRLAAVIENVLPAVERALAGKMYLEVDPAVVTQAADRMIARYAGQPQDSQVGIFRVKQIWELGNIANWLAGEVARYGGDPNDARYRETLTRELRRVWRAIGNKLPDAVPDGAWWLEVAEEVLAEARPEKAEPAGPRPGQDGG